MYISLGSDCCIAFQLKKLGLRECAFPFDWLLTKKINTIIEIISNDFDGLFENLKIKNTSSNFPLLIESEDFNKKNELIRVKNLRYNLDFVHDFKSLNDLKKVKKTYERRIKRFIEIMKNDKIKKILIRIGSEKEKKYINELKDIFVKKEYKNFKIKHISFEDLPKSKDWKRDNINLLNLI